jgi:hypothetical protein
LRDERFTRDPFAPALRVAAPIVALCFAVADFLCDWPLATDAPMHATAIPTMTEILRRARIRMQSIHSCDRIARS